MKSKSLISVVMIMMLATGPGAVQADDPAHWTRALKYCFDIQPENNEYGPNHSIEYVNGVLHANTKCGSFAAVVVKKAYPNLTSSVMNGLFNEGYPGAAPWFDSILEQRTYQNAKGTFGTSLVQNIDDVQLGDILVSKYQSDSASGHVMLAGWKFSLGIFPVDQIPGYDEVEVFSVWVLDSTQTPHGDIDSRTGADTLNPEGPDDKGIGRAMIYIMADPQSGDMVGWTWSESSSTIYQGTDPDGENYRPLIAGYLYGPGVW